MFDKTAMSIRPVSKSRTRLDALTYASNLFIALDTPISLGLYLRLKHREHRQLAEMTINANDYLCPRSFFLDYQAVKLLSKYPSLDTGIDTRMVALEKFDWAESKCRETNTRFRMRTDGHLFDGHVERVLSNASRKIARILGPVPHLTDMEFSFGPGSAYGVRGETSVYNKVTSTLECTYVFVDKLQEFLEEFPGWIPEGTHTVALQYGSQLTFVPKDAKTDRPICIEPLLNGLYQKGVGTHLRRRLKRHGISLDDQGINQKLALDAYTNDLSTVDFTSASDTISYGLVMDLLPLDWFEFLNVARCPSYEIDGKWKTFQKFSSMGNAYTFELESLIFFAIATSCCEELEIPYTTCVDLSVYGDDVIIPRACYDLFSEVTSSCGFTVNQEKSFREGAFFESCGHDYFEGILVRPFLLKKELNKLLPSFYATNTIQRIRSRIPKGTDFPVRNRLDSDQALDDRLRGLHAWCIRCIPKGLRVLGPEGFGDGHIIAELDESRATRHPSWDGWWFRTYVERSVIVKRDDWPTAYALYFTRVQRSSLKLLEKIPSPVDNGAGYAVRGRTRIKLTRVFCPSEWIGPRYGSTLAGYHGLPAVNEQNVDRPDDELDASLARLSRAVLRYGKDLR